MNAVEMIGRCMQYGGGMDGFGGSGLMTAEDMEYLATKLREAPIPEEPMGMEAVSA